MDEIINKIAKSGLITIDLEDEYKKINPEIKILDVQQFLFEGLILKEKDFRDKLKNHDWSLYKEKYVHIICSEDTILPGWTFLLLKTYLNNSKGSIVGNKKDLNSFILNQFIEDLNLEGFRNQRVIIKGCGKLEFNTQIYLNLIEKLQPVVKTLMYGEACSTVPLYKKPRDKK
ncbi:DUF2480 family protein [Weeksellaceae bacterium TAE3-ERU29]|nr:DUF2480 family protein [Weeksellaceae bacterium TAE3-ERU29]